MRAYYLVIADMRALELYASILEGAFVTGAKLMYKPSSEKASADELTSGHSKIGTSIVTHADSIYKFFIKLTRQNPSAFTKVKDNGEYKMYYHPLILDEVLMMSGLWEIYEKRVLTVAPNDVFIDVGAHIGSYTIPIAKKAQKVIAFEPNKYTFELLTKNISLNNLTNIEAYNVAVSKKRGVVSFTYEDQSSYSRIIDSDQSTSVAVVENVKAHDNNNIHLVNTIDLDGVLLKEDRVDWIKIDVEGHELDVLEGAMQTIRMHKPKIIIEIWSRNMEKIKTMTHSFGYSMEHIYREYFLLEPLLDTK
jgi:FkbM family methyltransferase